MIELFPASDFDGQTLSLIWNTAYAGYFVPMNFTQEVLHRHVRRSGIDLRRSLVGGVAGEPFGLSLAAVRGDRAWIGGFGIAPQFRRKGLAGQLMAAHLARLDAGGVEETRLEVIDVNPAREVYRRCGFRETRELLMLEGAPRADGAVAMALDRERLAAAHDGLNRDRPSWRREWPTVLDGLQEGAVALGVERAGAVAAYAVAAEHLGRLVVHDAAAVDREAAGVLFGALGRRWPGLSIRLVDEPAGTPLAQAAAAAGLTVGLKQVEMRRAH